MLSAYLEYITSLDLMVRALQYVLYLDGSTFPKVASLRDARAVCMCGWVGCMYCHCCEVLVVFKRSPSRGRALSRS
jgi:hypothetical protein